MSNLNQITKSLFHVYTEGYETLLTRYSELNEDVSAVYLEKNVTFANDILSFDDKRIEISLNPKGYYLNINISSGERLYGLGDASRDSIQLMDKKYLLNTSNITCYGPMPIITSSKGWALIINSTFPMTVDVNSKEGYIKILVKDGKPDFYVTFAHSLKELVMAITDVTGKPMLLPSFAYGLTIVQNERTNVEQMLDNTRLLRDRKIPCDILGLEPGWMETNYDPTVDKKWSSERFPLPYWHGDSYSGHQSFFYPLREKGMRFSLWLCENYDLYYEEERKLGNKYSKQDDSEYAADAEILDKHIGSAVMTDRVTKIDEPFFKHLEKFVDNGANCFKLDGYTQVMEHPDRYWGMKYHDDEIHNLYPLTLAKQMKEGFENHTGRRAMIYTSGAFIGTQKYAATWAGDTGGGPRVLNSLLNYAMLGHSNTSCDLDITSYASIHYAFLSGWTQLNVWSYYYYPWNLSEKRENAFRFYSELRESLFPYIYTYAHEASVTGLPLVRPMLLQFDDEKFYKDRSNFMLGDSLYVVNNFAETTANASNDYCDSEEFDGGKDSNDIISINFPDGVWVDYFTGKEYNGHIQYRVLDCRGGGLFVKKDSVIVTMKPQQYITEKDHEYIVDVFGNGSFNLYEDDETTDDYKEGKFATTLIESCVKDNSVTVVINPKVGGYEGRPNNGHDIVQNSIPKIKGMKKHQDFTVVLHNYIAKEVKVNDESMSFEIVNHNTVFIVEKELLDNKVEIVAK